LSSVIYISLVSVFTLLLPVCQFHLSIWCSATVVWATERVPGIWCKKTNNCSSFFGYLAGQTRSNSGKESLL